MWAALLAVQGAALPELPSQYTATAAFAECGNVPPCVKPLDHRSIATDGTSVMAEFMNVTGTGEHLHEVYTPSHVYRWTDGATDCTADPYDYPVQADWAWLNKTTTKGPSREKCVTDPSKQCQVWRGPWPEQVTAEAVLWVRVDADGTAMPDALQMTCGLFPFTIYKNYSDRQVVPADGTAAASTTCSCYEGSCNLVWQARAVHGYASALHRSIRPLSVTCSVRCAVCWGGECASAVRALSRTNIPTQ
jgi:hypothetical protein